MPQRVVLSSQRLLHQGLGKLDAEGWPAGRPPAVSLPAVSEFDAETDAFLSRELVEAARWDMDAFVTAVMRDEKTGLPLDQAPVHIAWHELADQHDRLLIWAAIDHGKTSQLSVARTLWLLGKDPTLRIAIVSNTARQAEKVLRSIKRYIETSAELHVVFPELRPMADQWTSHSATVRRPTTSKDPSVQTLGIHGNILGSRVDHLILDDLLDTDNSRTAAGREDCFLWVQANCLSRLTINGRVLVVGTAFHPDDTLHRLARLPGWKAFRYPVITEAGEPRWPEHWPPSRIQQYKDTLGPSEFARQLLCVARSDDESRFKKEWIDWCLARGNGKQLCYGMDKLPPGFKTYTGVDLAVQQKDASDSTCLFTIAAHPNGDREVLNIESGKWAGPDIVSKIIDTHRRYMSVCIVENNAAQDFIIQFARGQFAVPIRPFTTGRNKAHPEFGIESVAAEMAGKKWIIPSHAGQPSHPEIFQWVQEMLFYQPSSHTGDRLMASWFAREGVRLGALRVETGRLDVLSR
jgi:hypothetical protein